MSWSTVPAPSRDEQAPRRGARRRGPPRGRLSRPHSESSRGPCCPRGRGEAQGVGKGRPPCPRALSEPASAVSQPRGSAVAATGKCRRRGLRHSRHLSGRGLLLAWRPPRETVILGRSQAGFSPTAWCGPCATCSAHPHCSWRRDGPARGWAPVRCPEGDPHLPSTGPHTTRRPPRERLLVLVTARPLDAGDAEDGWQQLLNDPETGCRLALDGLDAPDLSWGTRAPEPEWPAEVDFCRPLLVLPWHLARNVWNARVDSSREVAGKSDLRYQM